MPDFKPPDPGQLRRRVAIQSAGTGPAESDDFGSPAPAWSDVATQWARVEEMSGRELDIARQQFPTVSVRVTVRNARPIRSADRLDYRGRLLQILSVAPDESGAWLVILATDFGEVSP